MRILMFFHGGSTNRGAEAIIRVAVPLLRKKFPDANIDLASRNPNSDKEIPDINSIIHDKYKSISPYSLNWFISVFNIKILKNETFAFRKIHRDIIDIIPNYDLFLSIGGDNYCYGEQPGIYEIDRQIKKAGKKLVLWGASICENDLTPGKIKDLQSFDLILARETYTYKTLQDLDFSNMQLCADGAFLLEKEELPLPEYWQEGNTIGFNYSPLVYKKNPKSKQAAKELIQYILDTTSMTIAFTPHVINNDNNDHEILLEFYHEFKNTNRVFILPNNLNAIQYKGYISRMRFFIGARTHATIAAYSSFVPTMVLGYSVKSKGISYDLFGEEKLVLSIEEIANTSKLTAKFDELINEENLLIKELKTNIPIIKKQSLKAVSYLSKLI